MFVQLRAPGTGAPIALALVALAALAWLAPWRPHAEPAVPAAEAAPAESEAPAEPAAPADGILRVGLESPFVHDAGDGIVHLGIRITPPVDAAGERAPVALAMVLDSSGSMDGLPMEHARFAARSVIERLADDDRVAVIDFDGEVRTPVPLTPAGRDRSPLIQAIDAIRADGSTALHGGVSAGLAALSAVAPGTATRRLILVSDGRANVGPETPEAVVAGLDPAGVTVSTIGVGTDYDEALMLAVADHGRGGFHHLSDPVQLASILDAELRSARAVVGRDATVDLMPAPGVTVLSVGGLDARPTADGVWRLPVGDLYAGEARNLTVRLKVPVRARLPLLNAPRMAARVALSYQPVGGGPAIAREASAAYVSTPSPSEVRAGLQPQWMVAADRMRVSHVLVDAAALLRGGDLLEAQALLRDERARLKSRRGRTDGAARGELDALIGLLADPYVDAALDGAPPVGADLDDRFAGALESVRAGRAVGAGDLAGLDAGRLRILRNAAYARHGYRFRAADLRAFFGGTAWYAVDPAYDPGRLTAVDGDNVRSIKAREQALLARAGGGAVRDFELRSRAKARQALR